MMDECEMLLDKVVSEGHDSLTKMEDKKLNFHFKVISREVMARAKVIFSTLDNVTNDVISSSFGRDAMGVMLSLDEATMATEPAFWTLLTSIFNAERIENEFGGVDPIKGIIMSGDKRQIGSSSPVICSMNSTSNSNCPSFAA
jgi:hypothetical protein